MNVGKNLFCVKFFKALKISLIIDLVSNLISD